MNIIIGKNSNLSNAISKIVSDIVLISSREVINNIDILENFKNQNINIIFNNFYPSHLLSNLENEVDYLKRTIGVTRLVLNYFDKNKVDKVIYSSSASVYGAKMNSCIESDLTDPLSFYGQLKLENEIFVRDFCIKSSIDYSIARNFNFFGGEDKFSIIHKLIQSKRNNSKIILNNNGIAIRDYIHIDDAALIYSKLLKVKDLPLINIGTGIGSSVRQLINFLDSNGIVIDHINVNQKEIQHSVADTSLLIKTIGEYKFKNVLSFVLKEISK
jgi:UDP-glucose 4-epimerase